MKFIIVGSPGHHRLTFEPETVDDAKAIACLFAQIGTMDIYRIVSSDYSVQYYLPISFSNPFYFAALVAKLPEEPI